MMLLLLLLMVLLWLLKLLLKLLLLWLLLELLLEGLLLLHEACTHNNTLLEALASWIAVRNTAHVAG